MAGMRHRTFLADGDPMELAPVLSALRQQSSALASSEPRGVEEVRDQLRPHLVDAGWTVAEGSRDIGGVVLPASVGLPVRADAASLAARAALFVETGGSWTANGFLEHLMRATVCPDVEHLAVAVGTDDDGRPAYDKVIGFLDPVLGSGRVSLPYRSVLIAGVWRASALAMNLGGDSRRVRCAAGKDARRRRSHSCGEEEDAVQRCVWPP